VMFVAMACVGLIEIIRNLRKPPQQPEAACSPPADCTKLEEGEERLAPLLHQSDDAMGSPKPAASAYRMLIIPAACDILGSWLMFAGAMWVPASVVQMLGAFNPTFCCMLAKIFLGRTPQGCQIKGGILIWLGLALVAVSRFCVQGDDSDESTAPTAGLLMLGVALVVFANLSYAAEATVSEVLIKDGLSPYFTVGMMGVYGIAFFIPLFVILYFTPSSDSDISSLYHEDISDTFHMLSHSNTVSLLLSIMLVLLFFFNIGLFEFFGRASAVTATVINLLVSPAVWVVDLILGDHGTGTGEKWSDWSFMQLGGYAFVVLGTIYFNGLFEKAQEGEEEGQQGEQDISHPA